MKIDGKKVADFNINLFIFILFSSKKIKGKLKDIKNISGLQKKTNAIPWEFKYYEKSLGFCVQR